MITRNRAISILFALAVLSGCASTKVTQQTPGRARGSPAPIKSGSTTSSPTRPRSPPIPILAPISVRRPRLHRRGTGNRA